MIIIIVDFHIWTLRARVVKSCATREASYEELGLITAVLSLIIVKDFTDESPLGKFIY